MVLVSIRKNEIKNNIPRNHCPEIILSVPEKGKYDTKAIIWAITNNYKCANNSIPIPVKLNINWDNNTMRYNYFIENK